MTWVCSSTRRLCRIRSCERRGRFPRTSAFSGDWLNNGPSSGDGGLFRLGLPGGLAERLTWKGYGDHLAVGFISRFDQIHFKLYAAVDQSGGYHATDLHALAPTDEELLAAAAWSRSHDPSPGYRQGLKAFLEEFGHGHLGDRI